MTQILVVCVIALLAAGAFSAIIKEISYAGEWELEISANQIATLMKDKKKIEHFFRETKVSRSWGLMYNPSFREQFGGRFFLDKATLKAITFDTKEEGQCNACEVCPIVVDGLYPYTCTAGGCGIFTGKHDEGERRLVEKNSQPEEVSKVPEESVSENRVPNLRSLQDTMEFNAVKVFWSANIRDKDGNGMDDSVIDKDYETAKAVLTWNTLHKAINEDGVEFFGKDSGATVVFYEWGIPNKFNGPTKKCGGSSSSVADAAADAASSAASTASSAASSVKEAASTAASTAADTTSSAASSVADTASSAASSATESTKEAVSNVGSAVTGLLGSGAYRVASMISLLTVIAFGAVNM